MDVKVAYNSPFFVSIFRNALLHFSTLFDMFAENFTPGMKMQIGRKKIVLLAMNPGKMMDGEVISMIRGEATRGSTIMISGTLGKKSGC